MIQRTSEAFVLFLVTLLVSCSGRGASGGQGANADSTGTQGHELPDTLRVATLYSPTSYFIYRDEAMGYDYSLVSELAREKGIVLKIEVAPSLASAVEMIEKGQADVLASRVPVTADYVDKLHHCGPEISTTQVLVQRLSPPDSLVRDVTSLPHRTIWVEGRSKYEQRLRHLDQELGGGINICTVDPDSLTAEDLVEMVSDKKIPLTIVDSDVARLNKTYFPDLDISLELSFKQNARWAVAKEKAWLGDSIDAWLGGEYPRRENDILLRKYFELAKNTPTVANFNFKGGKISQYDNLFRHSADAIGWDWRLLAAVCFVESGFRNDVTSWAGAKGIMQIMPSTGRLYGVDAAGLLDPATSIETAAKIFKVLEDSYKPQIKNQRERLKFILAAYNSGPGHISDAIALARKYGHDPAVWEGNVAECLMLKSNAGYYNDPVVRNGYFRARETLDYVDRVLDFYDRAVRAIHR